MLCGKGDEMSVYRWQKRGHSVQRVCAGVAVCCLRVPLLKTRCRPSKTRVQPTIVIRRAMGTLHISPPLLLSSSPT